MSDSASADPARDPIVIAVPKGRILKEALPLLARAGIVPEAASTALSVKSSVPVRVKSLSSCRRMRTGAVRPARTSR